MKSILSLIFGLIFISSVAIADTSRVDRSNVYHHFTIVNTQVPYNIEVCTQGHSYNSNTSSTDAIIGAIIGGTLGNQVGSGRGKDAATILGVILGADIINKNNKSGTVGPSCIVESRYKESTQEVYSHSTITFMIDGRSYSSDYIHQF